MNANPKTYCWRLLISNIFTYRSNLDMRHNVLLTVYIQTNCYIGIRLDRIDEFALHSFAFEAVSREFLMVLLCL